MRLINQIFIVAFLLVCGTKCFSQETVALKWARKIGGTTNDLGRSITTDVSGNVYATGDFRGTVDFDPGAGVFNLTSQGLSDIFVSKLDANGNFVWAKAMGGPSGDGGNSVVVDASGNVYTTGTFRFTADFDPGPSVFNLIDPAGAGGQDIFVSKLDASGNFIWAKQLGGPEGDNSSSIAVDDLGNVLTTGYFQLTADFDPGPATFNLTAAAADIFVSKLDALGNFVWAKAMGGTGVSEGRSITTDLSGNVYTTGQFDGVTDFDPGAGVFNLTAASEDIFVSKMNASGNFAWAKQLGGASSDVGYSIAVDASGNVHTTGSFASTADFDPGPGIFNLISIGALDIFVSKLDTNGNFIWAKQMGGTGLESGVAIALDALGNVFTTGQFQGTVDFDPGAGAFNLTDLGILDIFVSKLDASGNFVWAIRSGGTSSEYGTSIAVDNSFNIFITGDFNGTVDFDPTSGTENLTPIGGTDIFIQSLNQPLSITSFTPTSGPVGTTVIITGTNFSTTPANNTVRFNGTTAVVTASTATSITTTVPTGATTGTISVTVAGNTATSTSNFTVTTPSPTITSFTPTSGPVGTTVTITGTNFSATPANNIVYFGATRGTVTAATSTQIEVTVPVGATFQPISVLVNGLVTYTRQPFIVNFGCSQIIDASAFAPKVDVTTGLEPYAIALGDFDQDGKIDMATANFSDNTISIFRNTSSGPGNVSYASKIDFSTGAGSPYALSIGDFDGDGKQDVAVANETTNTVSVFRNTSTGPGNINFAGKIDFATGLFPHGITSTDFNLDGKVDLAVTSDTDDVISVFRNTSSGPGVINFGLRIDFPTGQAAQDVSNGDLDGDGLFDLVVTNYTSNTISVFRNTSAAGSITFAAKVDLPTGDSPNSVSIGDLDGDGKADIAVANAASNNVSLFRNTSSGVGSIAFAVQADLPAGVGAFWVAMSNLSGDGKTDLAVPDFGDKVAVFQNTSTGAGNIGFATNQDFLTGNTPQAVAIGDLDGDGKADLAVANQFGSSISVLLNLVASLPPPTITGFSPTAGTIGTPVTINGTNFNTTSLNTIVKFNGVTAVITGSTPTSITTTVPAGASSGTVMVTVGCNSATSAGSFIIIPVINITLQPSDFIACEGVTASFTTNSVGTSNITYQWQFSPNGPPAFVDIANGPNYSGATTNSLSINTTGAFGVGRYRCRINGDLAAEVITNDEGLFINTLPSPPGTSGNSGCASTSISMSASGGINGQYRWYTLSAGGTPIGGAVNDSYLSPLLSATTVYYVAINNGTCESARSSVTATVILLPSSPTVTGGIGCSPTATVLLNSSGGIDGQYRWYMVSTGGSPIAGEMGNTYNTPPLSTSTTYFVSINNGTCESPRISVLAEIKSCTPVIAATALESTAGGKTTLDIAPLVSTVSSPIDISSITVVQQPISGAMASVTNGVLEVDYAGIPFVGTDRLTIEACDQASNCAQQEITIEVAGDLSVYNAISPNGDGKNEELTIQYIDILPSTKSNKVTIFNRWGDVVFEAKDYDNITNVFRGLNQNGNELPSGTYFYRIDFEGSVPSKTGYLSLRK